MNDFYKEIISDFFERDLSGIKPREISLPELPGRIITVTGARRSGKTCLLLYHIQKLRSKTNKTKLLYINFENDRLFPFTLEKAQQVVDTYYEMFPDFKQQKVYFFFDEIQNIPEWHLFVRRLYDTEKCFLFLTGSSSGLLSREIATSLRGRTLTFEVFPLSFREYLQWKEIEIPLHISSSKKAEIIHAFNYYRSNPALPELFFENDYATFPSVLHEYVNMVVYKDLVERHALTQHALIKHFIKFLSVNISNFISIHKLFNDFKSQGLQVSKNTLYDFLTYLEDSYIFYTTSVFSESTREQHRNQRKLYCVDIGLKLLMDFETDKGRLLENIVFLQLRRNQGEIFYFKGNQEVDFLVNKSGNIQLINVAYTIADKKTFDREINSLLEAMVKTGITEGTLIIGEGNSDLIIRDKNQVHIIPAWKWLLT